MIPNPPAAVHLLREHALLVRAGMDQAYTASHLAVVLSRLFGPLPWRDFLACWHLHLQAIPFETAAAAWGIAAATRPSAATFTLTSPAQ